MNKYLIYQIIGIAILFYGAYAQDDIIKMGGFTLSVCSYLAFEVINDLKKDKDNA